MGYSAGSLIQTLSTFTFSYADVLYSVVRGEVLAATNVLSLADAKSHLRVDHSDEDDLITAYIGAAVEVCEQFCENSLQRTSYTITADTLLKFMQLPNLKFMEISSVKYYDSTDTEQTVDAGAYRLDQNTARLVFPSGAPSVNSTDHPGGVSITVTAGYDIAGTGATANRVPPSALIHAVKLILGHLYESRQDVTDFQKYELPLGAMRLMGPYRVKKAG